ncbi:hypothetical protein CWB73_00430 [Pseudoalteromonas phenolica]|uniref:Uncharacterized protein n=1 Tax=Pseudoalteromonas phenolica TaxID=161398 RepID=A0A5S3YYS1_9GAMM|nr:hypothetical protein [Pseudoalteromonas phenolica]TMP84167.1 hypothetical protein CWB73_00430 [Pseudoalteromonas phenolica]
MKLLKYEGKTVPVEGGTIPLRNSKNSVIGVFRHHCGNVATVHQYSGQKKKHLRYLHCDNCGCDQAAGEGYQKEIRENIQPTLEALYDSEPSQETVLNAVSQLVPETLDTPIDAVYSDVDHQETEVLNPQLEVVENELTEQPTETPSDAVESLPEQPAVEPIAQPNTPAANDSGKTKKIAVCAVLGAIVGGLFAIAR